MTYLQKLILILLAIVVFVYFYNSYYYEFLENENSVDLRNVVIEPIFKNFNNIKMVNFLQGKKINPENLAKFLQELKISSSQLMKEENIPKIMSLLYKNKMILV